MTKKRQAQTPAAAPQPGYTIQRKERSRFWEVIDPAGELVCITVYKARRGGGGTPDVDATVIPTKRVATSWLPSYLLSQEQ